MLAGNAGPLLDALIGGWHVSGIFRWTRGFPITIDNGFTWATNWNIEGDAMPNGPAPVASNPKNAIEAHIISQWIPDGQVGCGYSFRLWFAQ